MNKVLRYIIRNSYKPLLVRYLSNDRIFKYNNIKLKILKGVFHPGFFFSSKLLLIYVEKLSLKGKRFIEPGTGSGLIAIAAAKQGAIVTAIDINPAAVECCKMNAMINNVDIEVIESDLFDKLENKVYDVVAINPPYYKKNAEKPSDFAWYCGEDGAYFKNLFSQLKYHIHPDTEIIMTLCDGCDIEMIMNLAAANGFEIRLVKTKRNIVEQHFLYKIELQDI